MKIRAIYENDEGQHQLDAVLSPEQLKFLLEYALLELLRKGLMVPVVHNESVTLVDFSQSENETSDAEAPSNSGHAS